MSLLSDVLRENREHYLMATRASGVGGPAGVSPLGERPGMSSRAAGGRAWDNPTGRAHIFAVGAFILLTFLHVAAENRTA